MCFEKIKSISFCKSEYVMFPLRALTRPEYGKYLLYWVGKPCLSILYPASSHKA